MAQPRVRRSACVCVCKPSGEMRDAPSSCSGSIRGTEEASNHGTKIERRGLTTNTRALQSRERVCIFISLTSHSHNAARSVRLRVRSVYALFLVINGIASGINFGADGILFARSCASDTARRAFALARSFVRACVRSRVRANCDSELRARTVISRKNDCKTEELKHFDWRAHQKYSCNSRTLALSVSAARQPREQLSLSLSLL